MTGLQAPRRSAADAAPLPLKGALLVLQLGALACVLVASPFELFDLDRHSVPKELVLHAAAALAGVLCLISSRRLRFGTVDTMLGAYLCLSVLSALPATNPWLAFRAVAVSVSGAVIFWSARALAGAGLGRELLGALAGGVVLAASTALVQAYGLVTTGLASLSRAPGGTFGNRNFVAHLLVLGLPTLVCLVLGARNKTRYLLGTLGVGVVLAALVLSRTRAAWLALAAAMVGAVLIALLNAEPTRSRKARPRLWGLALGAVAGATAAVVLPNQLDWRSRTPYVDSARRIVDYRRGSGRGRLIQYRNTLRMVADHPLLGVGPGNWPVEYPRYSTRGDPSFNAGLLMPTNPWPSSDWVAVASEQGLPALGLLLALGAGLGIAAGGRGKAAGTDSALGAHLLVPPTLIALGVVGSFDAVIHLPTPAFYFWAIVGVASANGSPARSVTLEGGRRRVGVLCVVAAVGALFTLRSTAQLVAMGLAGSTSHLANVELAARVDPGNYRLRMLLAKAWIERGQCDRARPHALASARLFPSLPGPTRLLQRCGGP